MKIYAIWMSYEPGIIGLAASEEDAKKEAEKYCQEVFGDLSLMSEIHYDEFEMQIEEDDGGFH